MGSAAGESIATERRLRATDLLARHERSIRSIARRVSICADDADDAFQRAVVILLTKSPAGAGERLLPWMRVVTRREALAVRAARERFLGRAPSGHPAPEGTETLACERAGPADRLEARERAAAAGRLLGLLKPDERTAIALKAEGYSYAEICELTGWTYTKTNRCLAEGRARLRQLGAMD